MLELFKTKKNHFIGIDFGTASIKVVELSYTQQQTHLENYGFVDLNLSDRANLEGSSFEEKLKDSLKKLVVKLNLKSNLAYVSIPGFSGLVTIIDLPAMPEDELAKAIQFEAHKYIPSALDEIAMSWEIIEKEPEVSRFHQNKENVSSEMNAKNNQRNLPDKKIKVLLVAAPKKDIEHYDKLVAQVGLEVSAIELETFSIARSLVADDGGTFVIVDIGARTTNMVLVEKGIIRVNRNIDAGGDGITLAIMDAMKVSNARAEIFKKGDKDILNSKESAIVIPVLDLIVGELRRIIEAYKAKNPQVVFENVILSGGTSKMKGIEQYFARCLGEKIKIGNPWHNITIGSEAAPFTKELGASFAVAIGLALRGVEDYKRK